MLLGIGVIVAGAWAVTGPVLGLFDVKGDEKNRAWYFAAVLGSCIPARVLASGIGQFFQSQEIMRPSVTAGLVAMVCNLVFGLVFVLGVPFAQTKLGFVACLLSHAVLSGFMTAVAFIIAIEQLLDRKL